MDFLCAIKNLLKKSKQGSVTFEVRSWGEYLQPIKQYQMIHGRDQWADGQIKSGKRLYHYSWINGVTVVLNPEPKNKYDKYAIAIYLNNEKIGYVPKPINKAFYKQLKKSKVGIAAVHGGDFKYIDEYGDVVKELRDPVVDVECEFKKHGIFV